MQDLQSGPAAVPEFVVRMASNDYSGSWPFWVDVRSGEVLRINSAHADLLPTKALQAVAAGYPEWTHVMPLTVHQATFEFSTVSSSEA